MSIDIYAKNMLYSLLSDFRNYRKKRGMIVDDFLRSDFVGDVVIIILVIVAIRFIVKMIKKSDDKREEAARHPKTDAQKVLVRDVIAAIERDVFNFDGATVCSSVSSGNGYVHYCSIGAGGDYFSEYEYNFNEHGYFVSNEMAYILACQIADHFGGRCYGSYSSGHQDCRYYVAGPQRLASEREQKRQEELERQRIENLKHL